MRFGATYLLKFFCRLRHTRYKKHFIYWFDLEPTPDKQPKKGPTLTQKGTDPNTERDRPQHKKGPTPIQKRDRPQHKKGTDPNTERDRPQQPSS